jgi:hypothetical protein
VSFYDEMASVADDLLTEFGQAVTIIRPGDTEGTRDDNTGIWTPSTPVTQTGTGVEEGYKAYQINGDSVLAGDGKFQLSPFAADGSAMTAAIVGATITIGGVVRRIITAEPYSPGGTVLYIIVQHRA